MLDTPHSKTYDDFLENLVFGHCLMVGRQILVLKVGVRLPVPEPSCSPLKIQHGL